MKKENPNKKILDDYIREKRAKETTKKKINKPVLLATLIAISFFIAIMVGTFVEDVNYELAGIGMFVVVVLIKVKIFDKL